jgi:alpha-methylacyl-CoA racemase
MTGKTTGPLKGIKVLEFAGIGPGPFACMLLSDMGADIVTIRRPGQLKCDKGDLVNRGRRSIELDLKKAEDVATALKLIGKADVLIEGFRPKIMEKLGLGPDVALANNPRLVYGRMTGWGQEGPLSQAAGHDINYVAVTGALDSFRASNGEIVSPLNLVGDYGGGALYLVVGVLAALVEARSSGHGQVIDVAMCDGVASLITMFHALSAIGAWSDKPRTNVIDGGAHFYRVYECKDGRHFSLGAVEPQFYAELLQRVGIDDPEFEHQNDRANWPNLQKKLEAVFRTKTRDEWSALLEGTDSCAMAVMTMHEAPKHPHLAARGTFIDFDGHLHPAPAPRFSRTPSSIQSSPSEGRADARSVLASWDDSMSGRVKSMQSVGAA